MWQQIAIAVLSILGTGTLAWWSFKRQLRRNSVMQVYLDVAQAAYEASRMVALRMRGQVNKESLSAAEREEISKAFTSLLGRIGKLHLVASPKTMKAVNEFYNVLWEVYDGVVPTPEESHIFRKMGADDISAQVDRFDRALVLLLSSMRKDLGYRMKSRLIEHNSFATSFFVDRVKEGKALASAGDTVGSLAKSDDSGRHPTKGKQQ